MPENSDITVEVCVGDIEGAVAAADAGADRLELCADLGVGGTTPSIGTVRTTLAHTTIPVRVMVRPRGGHFVLNSLEAAAVLNDIAALRDLGSARVEVVTGALTRAGVIDAPFLREVVAAAGPLPVIFHKAFDEVPDRSSALEDLVESGVHGLLTSGSAPTAVQGASELAALRRQAAGRLDLTAAGGIRAHNVAEVVRRTRLGAVHFRSPGSAAGPETDPAGVRAVLKALRDAGHRGRPAGPPLG